MFHILFNRHQNKFLYSFSIKHFINGGSQERDMRAGTENIYEIVGFTAAKAYVLQV